MYRQDYIIRLIERFGAVIRSLRDRILKREREELGVRMEITEIAQQAGLDLTVARTLPADMLLMWLAPTGEVDPAKLWLLGELLYLEGLETKASGGDGWCADFERSASLLLKLDPSWRPGDGFASAGERLVEIQRTLSESTR